MSSYPFGHKPGLHSGGSRPLLLGGGSKSITITVDLSKAFVDVKTITMIDKKGEMTISRTKKKRR